MKPNIVCMNDPNPFNLLLELLATNSNVLFHGSSYKHDHLMPGFKHSGVLQRWDKTESNKFLYLSSDKSEAILNGLASGIARHWEIARIHWDESNITIYFYDEPPSLSEIEKMVHVWCYTCKRVKSMKLVKNQFNGSMTEYKTKDDIIPLKREKVSDIFAGRAVKLKIQKE